MQLILIKSGKLRKIEVMKKTKNEKGNIVVRRFYNSFKTITTFCGGFEINSKIEGDDQEQRTRKCTPELLLVIHLVLTTINSVLSILVRKCL